MDAPIIMHGAWEDNYDDPSHSIPSLSAIDVWGKKHSGGADLAIVIASPIGADERSQERLLAKIDGYLNYIHSHEYRESVGEPSADTTHIIVHIHEGSDQAIFDLLERSVNWVKMRQATLRVRPFDPNSM